ncbi:MAG: hypothetical protein KDB92_11265 [Chitinophagaceae bacterium]|nr:hypothetical protein [Chitinophagaceae bacterium]
MRLLPVGRLCAGKAAEGKYQRQKPDYIHWNPVKGGMCKLPEEYKYSSALFYETGVDNWRFLTHYMD